MRHEPPFLTRIRLRAKRGVLYMRHVWAQGMIDADGGLAISHSEVDRLLEAPECAMADERTFLLTDPAAAELTRAIVEADRATWADARLAHLCAQFGLTEAEADMLTLCVAVEIDPGLRRVFGYVNDESVPASPTPALAARLFEWPTPVRFGQDSGLIRYILAQPAAHTGIGTWSSSTAWAADPFTVGVLADGHANDASLTGIVSLPGVNCGRTVSLYPEVLSRMNAFAKSTEISGNAAPIELTLVGPDGAGKRHLAAQFHAARESAMLVVDCARLGSEIDAIDRARRAARLARLLGYALYWNHANSAPAAVWDAMRDCPPARVTWYGTDSKPPTCAPDAARRTFTLPPLARAARIALFEALADTAAPEPVAERLLLPSRIAAAARAAVAGDEAVREACQPTALVSDAALATSLPCPYTWDDLVVPPELRRHLEEIESQMRNRWAVYEDWGMERLCSLGRGIAALFAGPSGTGKTMAAQVMAASRGMELWRVDLAGVVSKYIGETEKNLKQVFDAAERAHVLLFFDEADALFGKRTEVKDAHDRFANIEIDYLLQRMERFDGLAILATNRKSDLDSAFLRRLRFIVDFVPPGAVEREILWRKALDVQPKDGITGEIGKSAPLSDDIDWLRLAEKLVITGAEIKSIALAAAFLARNEESAIGMKQIVHAAKRELLKKGAGVRAGDFGEWD